MKKRKKSTLAWSAAALALALTMTACGNAENGGSAGSGTSNPTSGPTADATSSPSASPTSPEGESPTASASPQAQTASGEYVGLSDGHTVEIKVDGVSTAFQIDPDTMDKVSLWESGTPVKFQYTEQTLESDGQQVNQLTITVIDKA